MKMYVIMFLNFGEPGESSYLIAERPDLPANEKGYLIPFEGGKPVRSLATAMRTTPMSFSARYAKQIDPVAISSIEEIPEKCAHLF